jgi:hypothetical protein
VGFFEAGNFHPDFILWLLVGGQQHVIFVDPKGIRNLGPTIRRSSSTRRSRRSSNVSATRRAPAVLHRLEHAVAHNAHALAHGEGRHAEAARILFQEEDKDRPSCRFAGVYRCWQCQIACPEVPSLHFFEINQSNRWSFLRQNCANK